MIRGSDVVPRGAGSADGAGGARTMAEIEEEAIRRALDEVDGNRRLAAERLGIGLRTLYEKLKRYGIS